MPDYQIVQTSPGNWAAYDPQQPWLILDSSGDKPTPEQVGKALKQAAVATGTPSRSTATIAPETPRSVTVGDFMDDPQQAASRVLDMVKAQIKDPKNLPAALGLAIGAFQGLRGALGPETDYMAGGWEPKPPSGPTAPASGAPTTPAPASPSPSGAPPSTPSPSGARPTLGQALRQEVNVGDLVDMIPGAHNVTAPLRATARFYQAIQRARAAAAPPAAASPTPPQAPSGSVAAPTAAPAGTAEMPPPSSGPLASAASPTAANVPAVATAPSSAAPPANLRLTAAETASALKWHAEGVDPKTIEMRILASRELTAATKTATPDQAAEAIRYRNATGKWPGE